ncbi:hypothetical protein [Streptomyces sp. NPDC054771]
MTTTPADELRQAAVLLRRKATAATHEGRTRWVTGHTLGSRSPVVLDDPEQPSVLIETYAARLESVNRYLALLGPATGLALADWLETASYYVYYVPGPTHPTHVVRALAVARQILGTTEPAPAPSVADVQTMVARMRADANAHSLTTLLDLIAAWYRSSEGRGGLFEALVRNGFRMPEPAHTVTEEPTR